MKTGVAQKPIEDMDAYRQQLRARLNPTVSVLSLAYEAARANPKRVLFAEGEEPNVLRAAIAFKEGGYGTPVLVGREDVHDLLQASSASTIRRTMKSSTAATRRWSAAPSTISTPSASATACSAARSSGWSTRTATIFAAAMLALGEADAMITGTTRPFSQSLKQVRMVIDDEAGATPFGINVVVGRHQTVLIADTAVTERPTAEQLAAIAIRSAGLRPPHGPGAARRLHLLHHLRQPAGRAHRGAARRGEAARHASTPTSNMKAKWAPTSRSTTTCSGASTRSAG